MFRLRSVGATVVAWVALCATAAAASGDTVPLGLDEAIERARGSSDALARLAALVRAADSRVHEATALRKPHLEAAAGYTRSSHVPELVIELPGTDPRVIFPDIPDAWRARLGASVPLHTAGRLEALETAARLGGEAARGERASGEVDLVLDVTRAYWNLVTALESVRALAEAMDAYDQHVVDSTNREQAGLAPRSEVLSVTVERDRAELALIEAESDARIAEADLARQAGLPPGTRIEPTDAPTPVENRPEGLEELVDAALASRPERTALDARRRAADATAAAERGSRRPQFAASAGYDYARPNREVLPLRDSWKGTWDVSLNATWSLFDGGRSSAAEASSRLEAEAIARQLADLDARIRLEVTARALDLESALRGILVADRAVDAAAEAMRIVSDRHQEGVATSSERLDAEAAWLRARLERTAALTHARVARARLDRAVGR